MDKYRTFAELQEFEPANHYAIHPQHGNSNVAVIAPHGGGIEPGTFEIARAIAGTEHTFYGFEGLKQSQNKNLHITSTHFDEPQCITAVRNAHKVLAIHGCANNANCTDNTAIIYIGGLDDELKAQIQRSLVKAHFDVREHPDSQLQGRHSDNICNKGATGRGVQLELTHDLRKTMFANLTRHGRQHRTPLFEEFVSIVRYTLEPYHS